MATQVNVTVDQIIHCPKCADALFAPVFTYASVKSNILDAPPILTQSFEAIKCAKCGIIIPVAQISEFTLANLNVIAAKEALNDKPETASEAEQSPEATAADSDEIPCPFAGDRY